MNWAQRRRLITVAAAISGALALAAVAVFFLDASFGGPSEPEVGDHWHAPYEIYIGDELQPPIPEVITPQGIHTHGDGIIHVHPHIYAAEGRLAQFFGDMGGKLTETEMRIPGTTESYRVGSLIDGKPAVLLVLRADSGIHPLAAGFADAAAVCSALPQSRFEEITPRYFPQDGDCIRIIFAPLK